MRLQSNGNGTITDTETGLMWQADPISKQCIYQDATNYASSLSLSGYNNWRLPTVYELSDLSKHFTDNPKLKKLFLNLYINSRDGYWTSSKVTPDRNNIWDVSLGNGLSYSNETTCNHFVLCVRDIRKKRIKENIMRPKTNGDGTVTDTKTGLMWQADPFMPLPEVDRIRFLLMAGNPKPVETHEFTWQEGMYYTSCLSLAGYDDWRLPTLDELLYMYNYLKRFPVKGKKLFPNVQLRRYWSSSIIATDDAGYFNMATGNYDLMMRSLSFFIWPIRG